MHGLPRDFDSGEKHSGFGDRTAGSRRKSFFGPFPNFSAGGAAFAPAGSGTREGAALLNVLPAHPIGKRIPWNGTSSSLRLRLRREALRVRRQNCRIRRVFLCGRRRVRPNGQQDRRGCGAVERAPAPPNRQTDSLERNLGMRRCCIGGQNPLFDQKLKRDAVHFKHQVTSLGFQPKGPIWSNAFCAVLST